MGRALTVWIVSAAVCLAVSAAPPDSPVNPLPADGTGDADAGVQLCAQVSDPEGTPLDVRFFGRDLDAPSADPFTIIVLPDTQYYSQVFPEIFLSQTRWIVENREALNIVFVTHVGDVVQIAANIFEWENADAAMSLLEDPATTELPDGIPYGISIGNHDQSPSNRAGTPEDQSTTENYNQYFGVDRFSGRDYYGGHFGDNNDNNYQFFSAGGMDFIVVHEEFDDTFLTMLDQVLPWTDQLIAAHRDRHAILVTHALLCTGVGCPSTLWAEWQPQGQLTYDALKHHTNLSLMHCGHAGTSAQQPRRIDFWEGHAVHTLLADYQRFEDCPFRCGNGWLRVMTFYPAEDEIRVQTYSPWLGIFRSEPCLDGSSCHDFTLSYDMDGGVPLELVGQISSVPSGTQVCVPWSGRQPGGRYEWQVEAASGGEWTDGPRWRFDSDGSCALAEHCEDGSPCTIDTCDQMLCERAALTGCCAGDADCDDGNYCTDDACLAGECVHADNANACSDGDPCTEADVCSEGSCAGTPLVCDDGNGCTQDSCLDGACAFDYAPEAACCATGADCDDGNPCTIDGCGVGGDCLNAADPDCCLTAADCDDQNACTVETCLRNGAALRFDGVNDHAFVGRIDPLGAPFGLNAREFTIECWFNWSGAGEMVATSGWYHDHEDLGGVVAHPLVTKGFAFSDFIAERGVNYFLGIDESGLLVADLEEHVLEPSPGKNHPVLGSTSVSPGTWHHAAATYDGRCWGLYLDGEPETDGTVCPGVVPAYESQYATSLAAAIDVNGWVKGHFGGLLDEVRVWDRALSRDEIVANMHLPLEMAPHLMGRWGLDDLDGVLFFDATGNEHFGAAHDVNPERADLPGSAGGSCVVVTPQTVTGVDWETYPELRLAWDHQPSLSYDVAGGLLSDLRADSGTQWAGCLADDLAWPRFVDGRDDPPSGDGHYYIIRSVGPCDR